MGSFFEFNDTLQITQQQGFPATLLDLAQHKKRPITLESLKTTEFLFRDKEGARIFHTAPTRVFLVQNIDGKWLYWGKCIILEQTISWNGKEHATSGSFRITELYDPAYQEQITRRECSPGKSYL